MKKTTKYMATGMCAFIFAVSACKKEDPQPAPATNNTTATTYDNGVFITCEGAFGSGLGTVSFYDRDKKTVSNDLFNTVNKYPLGNIVQSINIYNNKGYIVVNNAGKIEVVNASDFKSAGSIAGLTQPRYFLGIDNSKGYVTEWGAGGTVGAVRVINLANNSISSTITTGKGPENLVKVNNFVYVACRGGYSNDSVVSVISTTTDAVVASIPVGSNPGWMQVDANGQIWVLCGGQWDASFTTLVKTGSLQRINPATNKVELTLPLASATSSPSDLTINSAKNKLYYVYQGGVYTQDISASSLTGSKVVSRNFYGLGVDLGNDYIFGSDAGDFSSKGWVIRYTAAGSKVDSFQVGVAPGNFFFK